MAYTPTKWENSPSTNTPLNADNLNKLESGVKEIHDMAASGQFNGSDGATGPKGASLEYAASRAEYDAAAGITTVVIDTKVEGKPATVTEFQVKDGASAISENSTGFGLSVTNGKIELGKKTDEYTHIVNIPEGTAFIIGRDDDSDFNGILKMKGYLLLKEGGAKVGILSREEAGAQREGVTPLAAGECQATIDGVSTMISAKKEVFIGVGDGMIRAAFTIPLDNKPRAHITDYASDAQDADYLIVNKKYLHEELEKLTARISALEAK